jgi:hypothetical protein
MQTKVEELEMLNQSLRNRDKLKDDAIAQLSDQQLNILHINASKIISELNPGLEVNFFAGNEIEKLLGSYGTVSLIKKTPWPRPKLCRFLLLKDLGHITYMVTPAAKNSKTRNKFL